MEFKDLEGYPGHFYLGYVTELRILHPTNEKSVVKHLYNELLIFAGINSEEYTITESSVVIVPKDLLHGPHKSD